MREGTRGTETSKYPEEEKETSIPEVAASETGRAQTAELALRGLGLQHASLKVSGKVLGKPAKEGESPVDENQET